MKFNFWPAKQPSFFAFRRVLDRLIELFYLTIIFLTPLWFAYLWPTYNIFEFNKMALFRILVFVLLFFTALKIIFYPPQFNLAPKVFFKKYWLGPVIFLAGLGLSLLFSDNPTQSFYGTIERQLGYSSYLIFFLWFILLSFNILTVRNNWLSRREETNQPLSIQGNIHRLLLAIFWSGLLVSIYGILQILNIDFLVWPEPPYLTHRVFSTFGQPNFLASWLLLVIPISFYLFWTSRAFLLRSFFLAASFIQLATLFLSGSRGGLLAMIATSAGGLVYWLVTAAWPRRKKILVAVVFAAAVLLIVVGLDFISRGRVRELADPNRGSLAARSLLYSSALDAISQKPFFGYGLDHGEEVFIGYYSRDWGIYGNVNQSADHAHNFILDILLTTGFFGFALYIFFGWFIIRLIRSNLRGNFNSGLVLALAFGLAAYYFSLLFSFTIVVGEIYIWLFFALLVVSQIAKDSFLSSDNGQTDNTSQPKLQASFKWLAVILALFLSLTQISRAGRDIIADYYFNQIYFVLSSRDYFTALVLDDYLSEQAVNKINQNGYDRFWGDNLSEVYNGLNELTTAAVVKEKLQQVEADLPARGYKNLLVKARINTTLGNYQVAGDYLEALFKVAPSWPAAYIEAARLALARNDKEGALTHYYQASLNLPSPFDERLNTEHKRDVSNFQRFVNQQMASVYMKQGNYGAAEKYYQLAYRYQPSDFTLLKNIADTYYLRGDLNTAIRYNERGFRRSPRDYNWPLALAALYRAQGNEPQAAVYFKQARELSPNSPEVMAWPETLSN